jgi:murein DD-endopeptidase MepM/ murein hydrolase activator NlpD
MDFQIILLPREEYWSWVRACQDYVLAYAISLTSDPNTAANFIAPRQVVTYPAVPNGYPDLGDPYAWFLAQHPDIRLDPIEASTPDDLHEELRIRVETGDRFGAQRRPFALRWPTDYPIVTQRFGANPQIYRRWGLPGHEGLDIRALNNSNVYCCADGTVYEVHANARDHPYGIHVRVQHRSGYRTVYAHLARALVAQGEIVTAGQLIAKADSTGNSSGPHLHLTLKRDGATQRGETRYPKDIIDPTAFMVWPEENSEAHSKSIASVPWIPGRPLLGAHGRVDGAMEEADLALVAEARLEAVKLSLAETRETIERLQAINPGILLATRVTTDFSRDEITLDQFMRVVEPDFGRHYRLGIRYFEVHANPNLQVEGWRRTWGGGAEFSGWFRSLAESLRKSYPDAKLGFPGLSAGGAVAGQRAEWTEFLDEAEEAVQAADWVGVNCSWADPSEMMSFEGGLLFEEYRRRYPDKLIFVTEFSNPSAEAEARVKGQQYLDFFRMIQQSRGVGAAFAFALSASSGHDTVVWRGRDGTRTGIPEVIGGRPG